MSWNSSDLFPRVERKREVLSGSQNVIENVKIFHIVEKKFSLRNANAARFLF